MGSRVGPGGAPTGEGYADRVTESPHPAPQAAPPRARATGPDTVQGPGGDELEPLGWSTIRVVLLGTAAWALALVTTLVVPALHTGDRSWWPWSCVAGILLGLFGCVYVRRGRGNATGAR